MDKQRICRGCLLICFFIANIATYGVTVRTPNGTYVASISGSENLTQYEKANMRREVLTYYPTATILADATSVYNCHAYAWWISYGGGLTWINNPEQRKFRTDGSYIAISSNNKVNGSRVSFGSDDHSAIVSSRNNYLKSKWGVGPLVSHKYNDCPYNSSNLNYYNLSMNISGQTIVDLNQSVMVPYTINNCPQGATVTWSTDRSNIIYSGQGTLTATISLTYDTEISAIVHCVSGAEYPLKLPIRASFGPIIEDIEISQYGQGDGEYTFRVVTNQPDAQYTWSCDGGIEYENPYLGDAFFIYPLPTYASMCFRYPGSYTITVIGVNSNSYSNMFTKEIFVPVGSNHNHQIID